MGHTLSLCTIVVVWGDNGWHLGQKAVTGKNTLWDDGTRVPLIFAGPGVKPGQRCTQPAELLDIFLTLIELAGAPGRGDLEGLSLVPQLADAATHRERPAITSHNQGNHGIRSEKWRYIGYADGSEELYDMVNAQLSPRKSHPAHRARRENQCLRPLFPPQPLSPGLQTAPSPLMRTNRISNFLAIINSV